MLLSLLALLVFATLLRSCRGLHIDGEVLEQLILVLVVEAVGQEDPAKELYGVVEQLLPWIAGQSVVNRNDGVSVKVVFDADLGHQARVLGEIFDAFKDNVSIFNLDLR